MDAWKFLLEFHRITDEDIQMILPNDFLQYRDQLREDDFPAEVWKKMVESADDARRAILKIYSYESPLYKAVNNANMCQDGNAIKTLGPFSRLLYQTLWRPSEENKKV